MSNNIGLKMVMMHSFLLSRGYEGYEYTDEDIFNMSNPDVGSCQIDLYMKVIRLHKTDLSITEFKHVTRINYNESTGNYKIYYMSGNEEQTSEFSSENYFIQILVM